MIQLDIRTAQAILDYMWKDEVKNFCESFDVAIPWGTPTLDDMNKWIKWCEQTPNEHPWASHPKNHIFYSLLQLQKAVFISQLSDKGEADVKNHLFKIGMITGSEMKNEFDSQQADSQINIQKDNPDPL